MFRTRVAVVLATALTIGLLLTPDSGLAQRPGDPSPITTIYFVRHGEVDPTPPAFPLSAAGRLRADVFAGTVRGVRITHVFSSHTTRARQMVEPAAQERGLSVRQLPVPGTRLDGRVVSDSTASRVAIAPLVDALRELPAGSTALVGVNSDNVFALLHGLGVPLGTAERPCTKGMTCVPCLTNACWPGGEDQLWILLVHPNPMAPQLIELRYGVSAR